MATSAMQTLITDAIKKEKENERYYQNTRKAVRFAVLDLLDSNRVLPDDSRFSIDTSSINIRVPWGKENFSIARRFLGSGWKREHQHVDNNGSITITYARHVDINLEAENYWERQAFVSLYLTLDATQIEEGTCKRILVKEEDVTYKRQTYTVVCG